MKYTIYTYISIEGKYWNNILKIWHASGTECGEHCFDLEKETSYLMSYEDIYTRETNNAIVQRVPTI